MSEGNLKPEPIRNLNFIHARWGRYSVADESGGSTATKAFTFDCSSKGLPAFKDAATWSTSTDSPREYTGRTMTGKSEGLDILELVIETDPYYVYRKLATCFGRGYQSDLELCYVPRKYSNSAYQSVDGELDDLTIRGLYEGYDIPDDYTAERYGNQEYTIVIPRCSIAGLTPAGGENNSGSNTTVKFQAEGGPIENLMFIVNTHYFYNASDTADQDLYGWPKDYWENGNVVVVNNGVDVVTP